jgi:hypothetical protein
MGGAMNKRGIFFTTLVLVILTLFLISYTLFTQINDRKTIQKRVETLNNFFFSIEQDIPRQLHTSSFRILFLFEKRILEKGEYIDNINARFAETFYNGLVYGESNSEIEAIMLGATFPEIESKLQEKADKINADISLEGPSIIVSQDDPWRLKITLPINLSLVDKSGLVSWNKSIDITAYVNIEGFEDPTYPLESNNIANVNNISKSPYTTFPDNTALQDHAVKTYYLANTDAPSFIDRLQGDFELASPYGIESLAVPKLVSKSQVSIVDHEYFQNTPATTIPSGMPGWFYIDDDHTSTYQIS